MADSFEYLSPWLPTREGWYRLGHVRGNVHRWRLYKVHEHNAASGERWERWRLFHDVAILALDADATGAWSTASELPAGIRDRGHASELVELRFADLVGEQPKQAKKAGPR